MNELKVRWIGNMLLKEIKLISSWVESIVVKDSMLIVIIKPKNLKNVTTFFKFLFLGNYSSMMDI
jgi:hypothetical protein